MKDPLPLLHGVPFPPRQYNHLETASIYVEHDERYVVSLIVGYDDADKGGPVDAMDAAHSALELTRDGSHDGTNWWVYDRLTGEMRCFEQGEFDDRIER